MLARYLSAALIFFLVTATTQSVLAQTSKADQEIQKIKQKIEKVGVGEKTSVSVTMRDGTKFKGRLTGLADDSFALLDQKSSREVSIAYAQVQSVGSSKGLPLIAKIGIGIAIGIGVLLAVCYGGDQGCGYG